jgi:hypothetical protein
MLSRLPSLLIPMLVLATFICEGQAQQKARMIPPPPPPPRMAPTTKVSNLPKMSGSSASKSKGSIPTCTIRKIDLNKDKEELVLEVPMEFRHTHLGHGVPESSAKTFHRIIDCKTTLVKFKEGTRELELKDTKTRDGKDAGWEGKDVIINITYAEKAKNGNPGYIYTLTKR